jgi:signal transduction histidine kinase
VNTQSFVVDASLVQELGQRLIGRAPIALAELVKNSYDADARTCRIEFRDDEIIVSDDGIGMSEIDFLEHWMRIGTTHKVDDHTSGLGRQLTGSKGIGRLSVQFLADEMTLESTSKDDSGRSLYALIDWSKVVRGEDLDTVNVLWEMRPEAPAYPDDSSAGTRITLKKLKNQWSVDALEDLGREVWRLRSPFRQSAKNTTIRRAEDFDIEIVAPAIESAREAFDKVRRTLFENWKAKIIGTLEGGRSGGKATIVVDFKAGYPEGAGEATRFRETVELPIRGADDTARSLVDEARFEILIFRTEGRQPGGVPVGELRAYLTEFGNVSVYDAGFRLPYYGAGKDASGQDWLSIALDQGRRLSQSELLPQRLRAQNKYMLDLPAPGRIFGAVDIDTNHERQVAARADAKPGEWLQIQPGRDRLHDNQAFGQLRDMVRFSIDFYANRHRVRGLQAIERERHREPASRKYDRVVALLDRSKTDIPAGVFREIKREVVDARRASQTEEAALDRRAALLAPLATAGIAAIALSHELARETRFLGTVGAKLRRLAKAHSLPALEEIASEFEGAKRRLDSLRDIFAPLVSGVDAEATDRLKVRAVVDQAVSAMRVLTPGVTYSLDGIPADLRFPIGSLAEWTAILQNVLSNAWNAMLDSKKAVIAFQGGREARGLEWLRVSDTGRGLGVGLEEAPKLFEPFERRLKIRPDQRSIAIGGQGLGLAIVRMIARQRAATPAFVEPEPGFSTTFALSWQGGKK